MAKVTSSRTQVLEQGDIYFLYRPAVGKAEAHGAQDVQRFYIVLKPRGGERWRLIVLPRKRLPDPGRHDRFWAFVWKVFDDREQLRRELGPEDYETKTRGHRHVETARPAAEGIYAIARHDDHTHLAYVLELPTMSGPAERGLNIRHEASYLIAVKNPEAPSPPNAGLPVKEEARFPKSLTQRFHGRRFAPVDPPAFLDHEGAELVLIGADADVESELGLALHPDRENERTADVLKDLKLPRDVARAVLFEGEWA